MSKTNCRCGANGALQTAQTAEDTVAMNIYTNQMATTTSCGCRDESYNIARELYRHNRILEQILRTLRVCCGLPPRPGKPLYTTGMFRPEQAGILRLEAKNLRQCPQTIEAAVYIPGRSEPISEAELELCPSGTGEVQFPGTFEAGQCIELRVRALSSCLTAVYYSLSGEELFRFEDRDFSLVEEPV